MVSYCAQPPAASMALRAPLGTRRGAARPPSQRCVTRAFQEESPPLKPAQTGTDNKLAKAGPAPAPKEWETRRHSVQVAHERPLPKDLPQGLCEPSLSVSRDLEHPDGAFAPAPQMSVLQGHVAFFDDDVDGVFYPGDTYRGFRRLGMNILLSTGGAALIHGGMSYATLPEGRWLPDLRLPIYIDNIHRAKHGSDSEVYDTEGRWVTNKFEEIWSKYDRDNKGSLTLEEVNRMVRANRNLGDLFGGLAAQLEWWVTFLLAAREVDGKKVLFKDDVRGVFDGTYFYAKAAQLEEAKAVGRKR